MLEDDLFERDRLGLFLIFTLEDDTSAVVAALTLPFEPAFGLLISDGVCVKSITTPRALLTDVFLDDFDFFCVFDLAATRLCAGALSFDDGGGYKSDAARRSLCQCVTPNESLAFVYVASWLSYGDPNARHTCGVGRWGIVGAGAGGIHGVFGGDDTVLNDLNALLNF